MSLFQLLRTSVSASEEQNKVYGVVIAIVKDIKDPQNLGRVKVDFPWLAEDADAVSIPSEEDRAHSFWARIATVMAGNGRGAYFVPEVGDEVLVAFEHGDIDRPFVLGGLWNVDDAPPESMDSAGKNHIRSIRTRSGHIIAFDDNTEEQKAKVTIQSQGGHQLLLDDAGDQGKFEVK